MDIKNILISSLGGNLKTIFNKFDENDFDEMEEIRIRIHKSVIIKYKNKEFFIDANGNRNHNPELVYNPSYNDITSTMELLSQYSLYAFQEELKNGYITIEGGHRIGITGKTVIDGGNIKTLKDINGFNIRISHQIKGCANEVLDYIIEDKHILHTLIISPPGCGKTTLLRDVIRQLSNGINEKMEGQAIGVVDERSEIAGCYKGVAQNDIGLRTDVLDCCPKAEGMLMLIRSMSPDVIAVDEIGRNEDIYAIENSMNAGIKLICTVHGQDIDDIKKKPVLNELLEKGIFQRFIVLTKKNKVGQVSSIYNERFKDIYNGEGG